MKNIKTVITVLIPLLMLSCSPKLNFSWVMPDFKGDTFNKIVVIGVSDDLEARTEFEKNAVKRLVENGFNAMEGISIFPPNVFGESLKPKELIEIIKKNKIDAIITMSLVNSKDVKRYVSGESYTVPDGYYRIGNYIGRRYTTIRTSGYYVPSKSYLIEAVLYNLKGELYEGKETMIWNGQSSLVDPSSIESAAKRFTEKMINSLIDDEIIK